MPRRCRRGGRNNPFDRRVPAQVCGRPGGAV